MGLVLMILWISSRMNISSNGWSLQFKIPF